MNTPNVNEPNPHTRFPHGPFWIAMAFLLLGVGLYLLTGGH